MTRYIVLNKIMALCSYGKHSRLKRFSHKNKRKPLNWINVLPTRDKTNKNVTISKFCYKINMKLRFGTEFPYNVRRLKLTCVSRKLVLAKFWLIGRSNLTGDRPLSISCQIRQNSRSALQFIQLRIQVSFANVNSRNNTLSIQGPS